MTVEMKVPVLPELIDTAKIATLYVAEGHQVAKNQVLCDIETSKVVLELRAPEASRIGKIVVNEGDVLKADALIMSVTPDPELNHLVALEPKRVHRLLSNEGITTDHKLKGKGNIDVQIDVLPDFVDSATIIEIYVKEGDKVACGDRLCDVYTDKVILEVCAPNDGVVCDFIKKLEQAVVAGETIVTLYHPEYIGPETTLPESKEDNIDALIAQVLLDPALDNEPSTLVEFNRPSHQATCDNLEAHKDIAAVEATDSTVIDTQLKNESPPLSTQTGDSYVDLTNDHVSSASTPLRAESTVIERIGEGNNSGVGGVSSGKVFTFAASVIVIALAGYFLLI
ncbi:biotin/lipoyl-containing protein [Pseudoalteromonas sp. NC201]|uniref:biotin/lipoyl-containing protein n=1 Tax=Pseudoalteromonas sp. NC201 TaxID=1514074 RepID=UPI000C79705F|nr:biotin/lipoyl-containing protein [Pseudoalteromonas sp. NC201]AUJ70194.1 Dihydrolipoyllysine-residue succinyltransferase component of 2-oxoglutarate dehydrogenase complex [Pseudoalteromonas sp. NC201]